MIQRSRTAGYIEREALYLSSNVQQYARTSKGPRRSLTLPASIPSHYPPDDTDGSESVSGDAALLPLHQLLGG